MTTKTDDLNIRDIHPLISPLVLMEDLPLTDQNAEFVASSRQTIKSILKGEDHRLMVIVGPCSIHDNQAALEYAKLLKEQALKYQDQLFIIMRVYFEKPRTTVGWKGLINDPGLDGSFQINKGLHLARQFLLDVNNLELPAATEFLDTTFGQYYADLISLGAIGARTTESQVHRELASGLSMPVGFKNRTDGDIQVAVDAILAASEGHSFPSLTKEGSPAILETSGNPNCFMILRGGSRNGPNYSETDIKNTIGLMQQAQLNPAVVVDCSHANSEKDFKRQISVVDELSSTISRNKNLSVCGVMIESHLKEGNQKIQAEKSLTYGQSITDGCICWEDTLVVLKTLARRNMNIPG